MLQWTRIIWSKIITLNVWFYLSGAETSGSNSRTELWHPQRTCRVGKTVLFRHSSRAKCGSAWNWRRQNRIALHGNTRCRALNWARVIPQTNGRSAQEPRAETTRTDQVPLFREVQHEPGRGRMGEMRSGSHILNLTTKWMRASGTDVPLAGPRILSVQRS